MKENFCLNCANYREDITGQTGGDPPWIDRYCLSPNVTQIDYVTGSRAGVSPRAVRGNEQVCELFSPKISVFSLIKRWLDA
jgi:hypothetical protein